MRQIRTACLAWSVALAALATAAPSWAQDTPGGTLKQVGFDQNLGAQAPLDLAFRDEAGRPVRLGDYFGKKPVILTLVYFRCPLLCGKELEGLARALKPLAMDVGDEFEIVTVSISPDETPELAAAKKAAYIKQYGRPGAAAGWHFLTGQPASIEQLARSAGFRYVYDPKAKVYTHAAGLTILTPTGRFARYLFGIDHPPRDLQFALMEASARRIGSPIAQVLLRCYDFNAATGTYTLAILRIIRVLGIATVLALASYVVTMLWREHARRPAAPAPGVSGVGG